MKPQAKFGTAYFDSQRDGSLLSAQEFIPAIVALPCFRSVVDSTFTAKSVA